MSFFSSASPAWVAEEFSITVYVTARTIKHAAPIESPAQLALPVSIGSGSSSAIQHAKRSLK